MTVTTYPAGPITPHGQYWRDKGRYPTVHLGSHDGSVEFYLLGGESIPWPDQPECVRLTKDGIKNLIASGKIIAQKGATEDGDTFIDGLYDPAEPELGVVVRARDPRRLQSLVAELLGSIDLLRTSPLTITDSVGERWWANVRSNGKIQAEPFTWGESRRQKLTLRLRIDGAFWRGESDISGLGFQYERHVDEFDYIAADIGVDQDWDVAYVGGGGGHVSTDGRQLIWTPAGFGDPILADGRSAIMRHRTHRATDDDMIVELLLGGSGTGLPFPGNAANGIWACQNNTGTPGQDGIRAMVELSWVTVSKFVGGVETVLKTELLGVSPQHGDRFQLICAPNGAISVRRNGNTVLTTTDPAPQRGPNFRSGGPEMHAGATILWATTPAPVERWAISSNNTAAQGGQIQCLNLGDQPMYRTYTLVGPGIFNIAVAPGSTDMVSMGPLLDGQVIYLRTDPRKTTITDLTAKPPTPQQLNDWQQAVKDFLDFATGGNAPPLMDAIASEFGIHPPQGNLYSLLQGRFSTASAIPAAPVSGEPEPYFVDASITDGNENSQLISTGIPLRRYPLR